LLLQVRSQTRYECLSVFMFLTSIATIPWSGSIVIYLWGPVPV
jgi:hypothetical protein